MHLNQTNQDRAPLYEALESFWQMRVSFLLTCQATAGAGNPELTALHKSSGSLTQSSLAISHRNLVLRGRAVFHQVADMAEIRRRYQRDQTGLLTQEHIELEVVASPQEAFYAKKLSLPLAETLGKAVHPGVLRQLPERPAGGRHHGQSAGSPFYAEDAGAMQRSHKRIVSTFPISRGYQAHIPTYAAEYWLFGFATQAGDRPMPFATISVPAASR